MHLNQRKWTWNNVQHVFFYVKMYIMNPYKSQGLCLSKLHLTMFGFPIFGENTHHLNDFDKEHRRFQTGFSPSVVQGLMFGATFSYLIFFRWATFKASFEPIKSHGFGRWTSGHPGEYVGMSFMHPSQGWKKHIPENGWQSTRCSHLDLKNGKVNFPSRSRDHVTSSKQHWGNGIV